MWASRARLSSLSSFASLLLLYKNGVFSRAMCDLIFYLILLLFLLSILFSFLSLLFLFVVFVFLFTLILFFITFVCLCFPVHYYLFIYPSSVYMFILLYFLLVSFFHIFFRTAVIKVGQSYFFPFLIVITGLYSKCPSRDQLSGRRRPRDTALELPASALIAGLWTPGFALSAVASGLRAGSPYLRCSCWGGMSRLGGP